MFVEFFKNYKRKDADISQVLDADVLQEKIQLSNWPDSGTFGTIPVSTWNAYTIPGHPGLVIIRNPFTALGQRYWTVRCLQDYQKPPNPTNLSNIGRGTDDWWRDLQSSKSPEQHHKLRNSLRWVTLGYHHNWDTKVYSEESLNEFPRDLGSLISGLLAPALGYTDFQAQAAIVNYYPQGSTLSGHTDHSEMNLEAPLFSISFGQSAIFLIGGRDKTDPATPILLRSGDVLVMSKESRLCYHAVPRILYGAKEEWNYLTDDKDVKLPIDYNCKDQTVLWSRCGIEEFWKPFDTCLRDCRINLNVRQVLNKDQERIA